MKPLSGVRVVDRTTCIAGPYCTKMLADAGASVVKVEPADGDALRSRRSGGLYDYLNTAKRVTGADDAPALADTHVLVVDQPVDVAALRADHPALIVVTITPFGLDGPWVGRPATEFTMQAACGSTGSRGLPEAEPLAAGGRLGEWAAGTYAAFAIVAALHAGRGEHIDVAMFDCMAVSMITAPSVFADFLGWPPMRGTGRMIDIPSVEPTRDGWVVLTTNSGQQFQDLLVQIGRPDLLDDPDLPNALKRFKRRKEFWAILHEYTSARTSAQVLADARTLRVPAGPVLNGSSIAEFDQFRARQVFARSAPGQPRHPRPPYLLSGNGTAATPANTAASDEPPARPVGDRPLDGVRVLDLTAWWAGPTAAHALACLGADVIKVEAPKRPDGMRFATSRPPTTEDWIEWSPLYHCANTGKRAVTIDLGTPDGRALFESLVPTADVVIENYTPRVMDQFGLSWDRLRELNDRLVMVRMPAFGLDGPWRDSTGFAQTMECITGMAWVTGRPDGPPVLVRGACDPLAGMHAAFATVIALRARDTSGKGVHVESTMVEAAANITAEQVIEYDVTGEVMTRRGNRDDSAAPQGVYRCTGDDSWLALTVETDAQWLALRAALGNPDWAAADELANQDGRHRRHDEIDEQLASTFIERDADTTVEELCAAGVPAAVVISSRDVVHNPQLQHRQVFEREEHGVTGVANLPTMPFRFASISHWLRSPAPTFGQHNDEVLSEVVDAESLAELRRRGVVA